MHRCLGRTVHAFLSHIPLPYQIRGGSEHPQAECKGLFLVALFARGRAVNNVSIRLAVHDWGGLTVFAEVLRETKRNREAVVLVHGLAASRVVLKPLQRSMQRSGYETLNWGYPSIRGEIRSLGHALGRELERLDEDSELERFHLVTHSMGSILARAAFADHTYSRLGRVVMLGPPHAGSRVAANLARFLGWFCQPLAQLSDSPDSLVNNLPIPNCCEIGIIAAARDRVVRIENTRLPSQADHVVVNSGHTSMLFRRDVAELVAGFLQTGCFASSTLRAATASAAQPPQA